MENEIKDRIIKLFKPTLKIIKEQSECDHEWGDKNGAAYYRCSKCGYLAEDRKLDKLITMNDLIQKGMPIEMVEKYKDYI
jgi:hypothetical protein